MTYVVVYYLVKAIFSIFYNHVCIPGTGNDRDGCNDLFSSFSGLLDEAQGLSGHSRGFLDEHSRASHTGTNAIKQEIIVYTQRNQTCTLSWGQSYKTFYDRNLRILVIS